MAEVSERGGGAALKQAIAIARARAGITSDMQLSVRSGVHYDTLHNWYSGRTTPRPHEVAKVAKVLGISLADLMAAYEGVELEAPDLVAELHELVAVMREDREERRAILASLAELTIALGSLALRERLQPVSVPSSARERRRVNGASGSVPRR